MIEIVKRIYADKVRKFCIDGVYYTNGTNEEYSKMLNKCVEVEAAESETEFTQMVEAICRDIWQHSDDTVISEYETSGCTFEDFVCGFLNRCVTFIVR